MNRCMKLKKNVYLYDKKSHNVLLFPIKGVNLKL